MIETFIYILYDKHDIPFYIGKSISVKNRLYVHKLKYGNDIQMEILDIVYDWKFWESFYISLYKSWGFILKNKNKGGGGLTYHTTETKNKISEILKGHISHNKGKKGKSHTEEYKLYMSKLYKNRKLPDEQKKWILDNLAKRVLQFDLNNIFLKEYESIDSACNINNIHRSHMVSVLTHKSKTAKKYIWLYKEEYINNPNVLKDKNVNNSLKALNEYKESKRIIILDTTTNETYIGLNVVAKKLNISSATLHDHLNGKTKFNKYSNFKII